MTAAATAFISIAETTSCVSGVGAICSSTASSKVIPIRRVRFHSRKFFYDILRAVALLLPGWAFAVWAHQNQIFMDCLSRDMVDVAPNMAVEKCVDYDYNLGGTSELIFFVLAVSALFWAAIIVLFLIAEVIAARYITVTERGGTGE